MSASLEVIRRGAERVRTGPWRGDRLVAYLAPTADTGPLSSGFVRHCVARLGQRGYQRVVTSALAIGEQQPFLDAGFTVEQRLHLLAHDLHDLAPRPRMTEVSLVDGAPLVAEVVEVDSRSFDPFWQMDDEGISEAVGATPRSRFRVARSAAGRVLGYAITGRAGRRGYLQRLAVDVDCRRRGLGHLLVLDGLWWLRRWRANLALVNTQIGNEGALALYQSLGFRLEPSGLSVLSIGVPG